MKIFEVTNVDKDLLYSGKVPKLYHLSSDPKLTSLEPRVPRDVANRKNAFEDSSVKRVSFADSIDGCILGLQLNESDFVDHKVRLFVYSPIITNETKIVSNDTINSKKLVFDSHISKEWWILNPVKVEPVGIIEISDNNFEIINYKPLRVGDPKLLKADGSLDTFLYKFKWIQLG